MAVCPLSSGARFRGGLEIGTHRLTRAAQARHHGSHRNLKHFRHFAAGESFYRTQHQHSTLLGRQFRESARDVEYRLAARRGFVGFCLVTFIERHQRQPPLPSLSIERVQQNAKHPGANIGAAVELIEAPPGAHQRFLHQIFRRRRIRGKPPGKAQQTGRLGKRDFAEFVFSGSQAANHRSEKKRPVRGARAAFFRISLPDYFFTSVSRSARTCALWGFGCTFV